MTTATTSAAPSGTVRRLVRRCGYCGTGKIKGLMHDTFSGFETPRLVPICDPCLQAQYGGETIKALSAPNAAGQGREAYPARSVGLEGMMPEHWTPEELRAYIRAIKRAPKSQERAEKKRQRKLDKLFDRLHGNRSNHD